MRDADAACMLDKLPLGLRIDYEIARGAADIRAARTATASVVDAALARLAVAETTGQLRPGTTRGLERGWRRARVEVWREGNGGRTGASEVASTGPAKWRAARAGRAAVPYTRSRPRWVGPLLEHDERGVIVPETADLLARQRGWSAADSSPKRAGVGVTPSERHRMAAGANVQCAADSDDVLVHLRERDNGLAALLRTGDRCPSHGRPALLGLHRLTCRGRLALVLASDGWLRCTGCGWDFWCRGNALYLARTGG